MQFDSLSDFLAMGGYGFYVWWSYAIAALVLGTNIVVPWLRMRSLRSRMAREQRLGGTGTEAQHPPARAQRPPT